MVNDAEPFSSNVAMAKVPLLITVAFQLKDISCVPISMLAPELMVRLPPDEVPIAISVEEVTL